MATRKLTSHLELDEMVGLILVIVLIGLNAAGGSKANKGA